MPLSLSNYIQEAGRAGRGERNQVAYCTLFFREQDCSIAANQHRYNKDELDRVTEYCRAGDCCRYSLLANHATVKECKPWNQKCHEKARCDNCRHHPLFKSEGPRQFKHKVHGQIVLDSHRHEITSLIKLMLQSYEQHEKTSHQCDEEIWQDCCEQLAGACEVLNVLTFGSPTTSLSNELYCFLIRFGVINPGQTICSLQKFSECNLRFFIVNCTCTTAVEDKLNLLSKVKDLWYARLIPLKLSQSGR
jgi:superfamily II DNA helicase RecQ